MKLLIKSVTATPAGYLPGSVSELWQLAGAKSEAYFVKWGGPELVSRYFKRTDDGTNRIYNARMLEIIGEQSQRLCKKESSRISSSLSLSVVGADVVFEVVQRLFQYYKERFQRLSTYTLTESRKKKCLARLDELMLSEKCDLVKAEEIARKAIDNLAESVWHREHGHIDWTAQIFRSQDEFQKRIEFRPIEDSAFLRRGEVSDSQFVHDPNRCYNCRRHPSECVCQ